MSRPSFTERMNEDSILLMDGATGTELQRRGFELTSPGWSATAIRDAPETLLEIHRDYVNAGAEIITANTFRTHARNLKNTEWKNDARLLTQEAVEIARQAATEFTYIAGSVAPLEDCYSPQLTPSKTELKEEHTQHIQNLMNAGVDVVLIETQMTIREAFIAASCCDQLGLPFMVSFTCGRDGALLSGEPLDQAIVSILPFSPETVLFNCIPVDEVAAKLELVRKLNEHPSAASPIRTGAYANTGRLCSDGTWESTEGEYSAVYAGFAATWKELGITLIGGCCGTTPKHIESIHKALYGNYSR